MSGQVRPGAGVSSPHTYFKQQIHKNCAVLSYFCVNKRHVCDRHSVRHLKSIQLCYIDEINQANKKQHLSLHRLENGEINLVSSLFLLENNTKLDNWKALCFV